MSLNEWKFSHGLELTRNDGKLNYKQRSIKDEDKTSIYAWVKEGLRTKRNVRLRGPTLTWAECNDDLGQTTEKFGAEKSVLSQGVKEFIVNSEVHI